MPCSGLENGDATFGWMDVFDADRRIGLRVAEADGTTDPTDGEDDGWTVGASFATLTENRSKLAFDPSRWPIPLEGNFFSFELFDPIRITSNTNSLRRWYNSPRLRIRNNFTPNSKEANNDATCSAQSDEIELCSNSLI